MELSPPRTSLSLNDYSMLHDYTYDYYELLEEEALARLRDADNMSECATDSDEADIDST